MDRMTQASPRTCRQSPQTVGRTRAARHRSSALEVIALLAIAVLLVIGAVSAGGPQGSELPLSRLQVQAGDSLWNLAAAHPVEGLSTAQVAELLADANHLDGALIVPGQTILVPDGMLEKRLVAR
jgi:hypothetical protein